MIDKVNSSNYATHCIRWQISNHSNNWTIGCQ